MSQRLRNIVEMGLLVLISEKIHLQLIYRPDNLMHQMYCHRILIYKHVA